MAAKKRIFKILTAAVVTITMATSMTVGSSAVLVNEVAVEDLFQITTYGTGADADFKYIYYPSTTGKDSGADNARPAYYFATYVDNKIANHQKIGAGRFWIGTEATANNAKLLSIKIPIYTEQKCIMQIAVPGIIDGNGTYTRAYWTSDYDEMYYNAATVPSSIKKNITLSDVVAYKVPFGVYTDTNDDELTKTYYYDVIQIVVDPGDILNIWIYQDGDYHLKTSDMGFVILGMQFIDTTIVESISNINNNVSSMKDTMNVINNEIHTLTTPSQETLNKIEQIKQDQAAQKDKLDEIMDALASPNKPKPGEMDIGGFYDDLDVGSDPGTNVISEILNTSFVIQPLTIVLSIALISFILFGKKT